MCTSSRELARLGLSCTCTEQSRRCRPHLSSFSAQQQHYLLHRPLLDQRWMEPAKTVMFHLPNISGAHERSNKALRSAIQPSWTRSGSSSSREWPCCSQSVLNLILWLLACCCVLLWPPQVPVRCLYYQSLVDCGPHS